MQRGPARPSPASRLDDADQGLLEKLRDEVRRLDRSAGKPWDDASERLSNSALLMAKENGFTVTERHIMPEELSQFDECFLTGTAAEVTPVSLIGEYKFTPGDACRTLIDTYARAVTPKKAAAE